MPLHIDFQVMLLLGGHTNSGANKEKIDVLSSKGACNFPDGYPASLPRYFSML